MAADTLGARSDEPAESAGESTCQLPVSARVCVCFGVIQLISSSFVLLQFGTGGLVTAADPAELKWFHSATAMLLPAMLLEAAHTISSRTRGVEVKLHGREMSHFVVVEYAVKMMCYCAMANYEGGLVHRNMRATGPQRGCYTLRYIAWSIAVPTLIALNNYPLWSKLGLRSMAKRLWPNLFVTWCYVLASWVAQVTPSNWWGWFLVTLSLCSYALAVSDQAFILLQVDRNILGFRFKVGTVLVKELLFLAYGAMYLMGAKNLTSPATEQLFYTAGDVLLKVVQASVLVVVRNWEDLAELRHALERKVEAGKEDMSRLFRHASAPILAMTQDGVVVTWNDHLGRLSGVPWAKAVGTSVFDLVREESHSGLRSALASCGSGLTSNAVEVTLCGGAQDGRPMRMLLTLIVQLGGDEERTITAIGQDLTEVAAMRAMQERKTRITAVLGHELRSPLHGIMGLSGSMADGAANPDQKRQLSMIKGCAGRLLDLVTNIMEMAKSEKLDSAGAAEAICKQPVNIMDIVDEVVGMTKLAVDKNGRHLLSGSVVMMNGMSRGELPMVLGDPYKLTQLFYNLVTNAAKFTAAGSIQVFAREVEAQGTLEIDITDTGKGIAPEAMARIFDPFQQEEDKDARSFQGIGLGLSVALGIAKLHGGGIRVASRVAKGSTFTICLPCDFKRRAGLTASCEGQAVEPLSPVSQCPRPPTHDGGSGAQTTLEKSVGAEYHIVRAANCEEAVVQLQSAKERPSLVVLELSKPGSSSLQVIQQLGDRFQSLATLPVMMLFAHSPHGEVDVVQKPLLSVLDGMRKEAELSQGLPTEADVTTPRQEQRHPPRQRQTAKQMPLKQRSPSRSARGESMSPTSPPRRGSRGFADESTTEEGDSGASMDGAGCDQPGGACRSETDLADEESLEWQRLRPPMGSSTVASSIAGAHRRASFVATSPEESPREDCGLRPRSPDMMGSELAARFYREEIDLRDRQLKELLGRARRDRTIAWLAERRAEALDRELRFVRRLPRPVR